MEGTFAARTAFVQLPNWEPGAEPPLALPAPKGHAANVSDARIGLRSASLARRPVALLQVPVTTLWMTEMTAAIRPGKLAAKALGGTRWLPCFRDGLSVGQLKDLGY